MRIAIVQKANGTKAVPTPRESGWRDWSMTAMNGRAEVRGSDAESRSAGKRGWGAGEAAGACGVHLELDARSDSIRSRPLGSPRTDGGHIDREAEREPSSYEEHAPRRKALGGRGGARREGAHEGNAGERGGGWEQREEEEEGGGVPTEKCEPAQIKTNARPVRAGAEKNDEQRGRRPDRSLSHHSV